MASFSNTVSQHDDISEDDDIITDIARSISNQAIANASRRLTSPDASHRSIGTLNTEPPAIVYSDEYVLHYTQSQSSEDNESQEKELLKAENKLLLSILEAEKEKVSLLEGDNKVIFDNYHRVRQELHQFYTMADSQHSSDTQTLNLLRSQLQDITQERDCYKDALSTVKKSISSLMPLIPSIQSMAPARSINSTNEMMSSYVTTPTCAVAPAHSVDSGLSSQQPSTSRVTENVWPSPPQPDGSIIPMADLSITQINEEDDVTPLIHHHVTYTQDTSNMAAAPELSIVRIDQSDSSVVIQPVSESIVDEVQGIQAMINHLHQSIDNLVQDHDKGTNERVVDSKHGPVNYQVQKRKEEQTIVNHELETANEKIELLIREVEEMKRFNDELQSKEVDQVQQQLALMENELMAQRKLNSELKEKREILEMEMAQKLENVNKEKKLLMETLSEKTKQANDCTKLTHQLKLKEDTEDRLQEEISELQEQLITTQHKLAIEESKNDTNSTLLEKQLQSEQKINEELQTHLNKAVTSLEAREHEFHLQEQTLSKQIMELKKVVSVKEELIESIKNDKDKADSQCNELKQQISILTDQVESLHEGVKGSNDQVVKVCELVEQKDEVLKEVTSQHELLKDTVSQLEAESKRHLTVYEQSMVRIQSLEDQLSERKLLLEDKEKEIQELTIDNQRKELMIDDLNGQVKEKESCATNTVENYQTTVTDLQQQLSEVKRQLSIANETHVNDLKQLEEKLQAEHAGRLSLVKLQYTERIQEYDRVENELLNKIALLAPELEKESEEVRRLCKHLDTGKIKQLVKQKEQKLLEMDVSIKELSQDNGLLKSKLREAEIVTDGLEQSMDRAQATIHQLEEKVKLLVAEKNGVTEELEDKIRTLTGQLQALEQTLQDRDAELQTQVKDTSNSTLMRCLEGERAAANELTNTLQMKETELIKMKDQYVQTQAIANKLQQQLVALQKEMEQLKIHQSNEVEVLQRDKQHLSDQVAQLKKRRNGVSNETKALLKTYKRRCASLVFQKKYLCSELDAFYHCHHGALMMIYDSVPHVRRNTGCGNHRFKSVGLLVLSVVRMTRIARKKTATKARPMLLSPNYTKGISGSKLTIVMSRNSKQDITSP